MLFLLEKCQPDYYSKMFLAVSGKKKAGKVFVFGGRSRGMMRKEVYPLLAKPHLAVFPLVFFYIVTHIFPSLFLLFFLDIFFPY